MLSKLLAHMLFGVNEGDFVLKVSVAAILAAEED